MPKEMGSMNTLADVSDLIVEIEDFVKVDLNGNLDTTMNKNKKIDWRYLRLAAKQLSYMASYLAEVASKMVTQAEE